MRKLPSATHTHAIPAPDLMFGPRFAMAAQQGPEVTHEVLDTSGGLVWSLDTCMMTVSYLGDFWYTVRSGPRQTSRQAIGNHVTYPCGCSESPSCIATSQAKPLMGGGGHVEWSMAINPCKVHTVYFSLVHSFSAVGCCQIPACL
jgi:hypothetical protein